MIKHQEIFSMNRRTMALTESRLRGMIHEAVKEALYETEMNRDYVDDEGNKISGKQALIQQGSYNYPKYNDNQAVLNQARFVRKVVSNYLKTVSHFYRDQRDFETSEVFNAAMNLFREMNFENYRPPYDWNSD